jgi:hypothetical protein
MNGKFEVPAEGRDIYRSFVFPLQLPEDKWVKAVELWPTAKSSVHHALFFIDSRNTSWKTPSPSRSLSKPSWSGDTPTTSAGR